MDLSKLANNETYHETYQERIFYSQFESKKEYEAVLEFAKEKNYLIWINPDFKGILITKDGHLDIQNFTRQYREEKKEI